MTVETSIYTQSITPTPLLVIPFSKLVCCFQASAARRSVISQNLLNISGLSKAADATLQQIKMEMDNA
jgi:hypothetical protein